MIIVPAILEKEALVARQLLEEIRDMKRFERVQMDFIDGEYTHNQTFKPMDLDLTAFLVMDFQAHLMVTEKNLPDYLRWVGKVGYDQVIVQMEAVAHPEKFKALALDIHTPVKVIEPYLPNLELVTLMAIEPGFGGQEFDERVVEKIRHLGNYRNLRNLGFKIQVDGGVQKEHLEMLQKLGVDEVVVGARRALSFTDNS